MMRLDVLVTKEADWWVAQCLQYDLAAQAKTIADLRYAFERALAAHVVVSLEKKVEPFDSLPSAPRKYWDAWERALPVETERVAPPAFRIPKGIPRGLIPRERQFRVGDLVA
jgi:predicted RNase H-like HicB family nuclease